jgi:hypothetical protein
MMGITNFDECGWKAMFTRLVGKKSCEINRRMQEESGSPVINMAGLSRGIFLSRIRHTRPRCRKPKRAAAAATALEVVEVV